MRNNQHKTIVVTKFTAGVFNINCICQISFLLDDDETFSAILAITKSQAM